MVYIKPKIINRKINTYIYVLLQLNKKYSILGKGNISYLNILISVRDVSSYSNSIFYCRIYNDVSISSYKSK